MGLNQIAVTYTSVIVPVLSGEFLDIQATRFTLKCIHDMIRTYSHCYIYIFKACSNFWGLNDGFLSHKFKLLNHCHSQEVVGYFFQLWPSDFSNFLNLWPVKIVCWVWAIFFLAIYTNFGQVMHLFYMGNQELFVSLICKLEFQMNGMKKVVFYDLLSNLLKQ